MAILQEGKQANLLQPWSRKIERLFNVQTFGLISNHAELTVGGQASNKCQHLAERVKSLKEMEMIKESKVPATNTKSRNWPSSRSFCQKVTPQTEFLFVSFLPFLEDILNCLHLSTISRHHMYCFSLSLSLSLSFTQSCIHTHTLTLTFSLSHTHTHARARFLSLSCPFSVQDTPASSKRFSLLSVLCYLLGCPLIASISVLYASMSRRLILYFFWSLWSSLQSCCSWQEFSCHSPIVAMPLPML